MRSRRKARETALQALYQCDTVEDWSQASIETFFRSFVENAFPEAEGVEKDNFLFCSSLVQGVVGHLEFLDQQIGKASLHWPVPRMCRVDRNILRIAVFELAFLSDIPRNVSINEAIEIAKVFGSDDSPMFVNGVLDNAARTLQNVPVELAKKRIVAGE